MLSLLTLVHLSALLSLFRWDVVRPLLQDYAVYVVPVVVAAFGTELAELLQRWNRWLDNRSPKVKRILVATLAFVGMKAAAVVGVPVSHLGEFLAAALAFLFHLQDRRRATS